MNAFPTAGKKALLDALAGHQLRAALYTSDVSLDCDTRSYSELGELADGNGYASGGVPLTGIVTGSDNETAWLSFNDPMWPNAAFMGAAQMLVYDSSDPEMTAYAVLDFGGDKNGQGATFRVELPPANGIEAIIRI